MTSISRRSVLATAAGGLAMAATAAQAQTGQTLPLPKRAGEGGTDPGPRDDEPYAADRPLLPQSLPVALDALEQAPLFRKAFGDVFIDYYLKLKRNEAGRYLRWIEQGGAVPAADETTDWERREYFDFF